MSTLTEILASQEDLIQEAGIALPHQFTNCTYALGPVRQAVYLCLTCSNPRAGICSACSIACHTDHEQLELFPKRNFRCDCPTAILSHSCTLHNTLEEENTNQYGKNFSGRFCRCGRPYDAKTEREAMIQCLSCEDWFHESCLNLRERPPSTDTTLIETSHPDGQPGGTCDANGDDDLASEASSSGLPPPLISDYESFICGSCVSEIDTLKRWAGTGGILMVVKDDPLYSWSVHGTPTSTQGDTVDIDGTSSDVAGGTTIGIKRPRSSSGTRVLEAKRPRVSSSLPSSCVAPPPDPVAQKVLALCGSSNPNTSLGHGDVFLTEGWRQRWCRCSSCLPSLEAHPFLLEEEETYEPPEDPDSGLSLEELGMRALQNLPRDRAIDGIHAFNAMRDDLLKYLRPFARDGKVVNETDVRSFFDSLAASRQDRKMC